MRLTEDDHRVVSDAVAAAERTTSGEIVTIVAPSSDEYVDVPLAWGAAVLFLALAVIAAFPAPFVALLDRVNGWDEAHGRGTLLFGLMLLLAAKFAAAWAIARLGPVRRLLTPAGVARGRVRRRAELLFRATAERRTVGLTGVLLYLSLAERRAEIVADRSIADRVAPEVWGDAMAALLTEVRAGRPGAGMAAAVTQIGALLANHFPIEAGDRNELPDRLIEL